ncbi:hypothetical protein AB1278_17555 [Chryseobacterium sp. NRRL B-14798]|uniref:hypothetical protein n=1 Tax=Chryseobacterium sp. NRRL B-14798 TaxID=3162880 RepID=UPI003D216055
MKTKTFLLSICFYLLHMSTLYSQIGINTSTPTKMLDINGQLRVRNIEVVKNNDNILVADNEGNIGKKDILDELADHTVGDVKRSFQKEDHEGWYLLDGRDFKFLPKSAVIHAESLGFSKSIPKASNRFIKILETGKPGSIDGDNNVVLTIRNLPKNHDFTGSTTPATVAHKHSVLDKYSEMLNENFNGTLVNVGVTNSGTNRRQAHKQAVTATGPSGKHSHKFEITNAGGEGRPVSIIPQHVTVNTFIYLGK